MGTRSLGTLALWDVCTSILCLAHGSRGNPPIGRKRKWNTRSSRATSFQITGRRIRSRTGLSQFDPVVCRGRREYHRLVWQWPAFPLDFCGRLLSCRYPLVHSVRLRSRCVEAHPWRLPGSGAVVSFCPTVPVFRRFCFYPWSPANVLGFPFRPPATPLDIRSVPRPAEHAMCPQLRRSQSASNTLAPGGIERHETLGLLWIAFSGVASQYRIRKDGSRALYNAVA
jgi:hypothetical protein